MMNSTIGIIGLVFLLTGFLLNEMNKIKSESLAFNILNLVGAGFLGYYSYALNSKIFMLLNFVWGLTAAIKTAKLMAKKK